ncbi:glycosyltransferase [Enterococcus gallinarum]|nr:glycosyltransferase [Enterococcus gallinarum]
MERSLNSVLNQTYEDFEVIIIDDFSSDDTLSILSKFNDPRIRIIELNENNGANYARNIGIKSAKGEFIAFQDSDDFWLPNKLERQLEIFYEKNCDVVVCDMIGIDETTNGFYKLLSNDKNSGYITFEDLLYENFVSTQMVVGKKDVFLNNNFDVSLPRFQDWELFLRISKKESIFFINDKLVIQYLQSNSLSKNSERALDGLSVINKKFNFDINNNKKVKAHHLYLMGVFSALAKRNHAIYFLKSFAIFPKKESFVRFVASILGLY